MKCAARSLRTDKAFCVAAVEAPTVFQHGRALFYVDDALKRDRDVVLAAVGQHSNALQLADAALTRDPAFLRAAIAANRDLERTLANLPRLRRFVASGAAAEGA